jgi:putative membrane protein
MNKFILRTVINGFALFAAVYLVPGIRLDNPTALSWVLLALVFGLVNALVKPLLKLLTCAVIFLTLGLFTLVINTALFYVTAWAGSLVGVYLTIESFWAAFFGALIVSVISAILTMFLKDEMDGKRRRN